MEKYEPKGHGRDRAFDSVAFEEAAPPKHLAEIVHRYIHLRTTMPLSKEYRFHALPDACIYMVFDQSRPDVVGVSRLRTSSEEFNLGTEFHYINVRLFPGTWQNQKCPASDGQINTAYSGKLPLLDYNRRLIGRDFAAQQVILNALVEELIGAAVLVPNAVTQRIMRTLGNINSVNDMAETCDVSSRQLQRILRQSTGFTPHDFLKILRLQKALMSDAPDDYADQSHFIRSFRSATGYTPGQYEKKFNV